MAEPTSQFGRIKLGARGPTSEGVFKVTAQGLVWKKSGGGRHVEIPSNDIHSLRWTKVGRHCQLAVKRIQNPVVTFLGFRDQDFEPISEMCRSYLTKSLAQKAMAPEGRNWGEALIDGTRLDFVSVDERLAFSVSLPDVVQAQLASNKNDVQLEFQNDDTGGGLKMDSLCDMSLHVPPTHPGYEGRDDVSAAKAFLSGILAKTDAGAVTSADAIVTFNEVQVQAPRGRFDVEMHASFLKLCGQSQEFRVAYSSISRLFILPKTSQPHTLVAISLDPPIRKGQTYYQHILCQFHTDEELEIEMDLSEELFETKNQQCNGKLQRKMQGPSADVFSRAVRGLAAAKISRTGNFRAADTLSLAVKCSYKADLGHLYPLERAFFYVVKPPLLITHEEIDVVEFQRQGKDSLAVAKTFDFMIRTKNDQEYQFRNIQKIEWANLFEWAQAKNLRIDNLTEAQEGPGGPTGVALDPDMLDEVRLPGRLCFEPTMSCLAAPPVGAPTRLCCWLRAGERRGRGFPDGQRGGRRRRAVRGRLGRRQRHGQRRHVWGLGRRGRRLCAQGQEAQAQGRQAGQEQQGGARQEGQEGQGQERAEEAHVRVHDVLQHGAGEREGGEPGGHLWGAGQADRRQVEGDDRL